MSYSQSIYVGPYVRCGKEYVEKYVQHRGCPKCKKDDYDSGFCKKCGTKLSTFTKFEKTLRTRHNEISEDLDETLVSVPSMTDFHKKFHFYIPNVKVKGIDRKDLTTGDSAFLAITPDIMAVEDLAFKEQFPKHFKWLNEHYSELFVEWGILVSYA